MTMTKHSPGPWTAHEGYPSDVWHVDMPERSFSIIVSRADADHDVTVDEVQANARLIAAAPELLLVLLTARDQLEEELRTAPGNDEADAVDAVLVEIRRVLAKVSD
jgi:hypothetical protein